MHAREVRTHSDGRLDLDDMRSKVRPDDIHHPITSLICLENTHNLCGGRVLRPEYMAQVCVTVYGSLVCVYWSVVYMSLWCVYGSLVCVYGSVV